jgi:hypothetical protein
MQQCCEAIPMVRAAPITALPAGEYPATIEHKQILCAAYTSNLQITCCAHIIGSAVLSGVCKCMFAICISIDCLCLSAFNAPVVLRLQAGALP